SVSRHRAWSPPPLAVVGHLDVAVGASILAALVLGLVRERRVPRWMPWTTGLARRVAPDGVASADLEVLVEAGDPAVLDADELAGRHHPLAVRRLHDEVHLLDHAAVHEGPAAAD